MEPTSDTPKPGGPRPGENPIEGQPRSVPAGRIWIWAVVAAVILTVLYMMIA